MIDDASCPRLAKKARLRFDEREQRYMLLYPEKGLVLNETGAEVLKLCDGLRSVSQIVTELQQQYPDDAGAIQQTVQAFLAAMLERRLVEFDP